MRTFDEIQKNISKEQVYELYIQANNSLSNTAKQLNICVSSLKKLLSIYNIDK